MQCSCNSKMRVLPVALVARAVSAMTARGAQHTLLALLCLLSPRGRGAFVSRVPPGQLAPRRAHGAALAHFGLRSACLARPGDGDVSVLPKPTKGFGKPCIQQTPRPSRYGGGAATQQVLAGACLFFSLCVCCTCQAMRALTPACTNSTPRQGKAVASTRRRSCETRSDE